MSSTTGTQRASGETQTLHFARQRGTNGQYTSEYLSKRAAPVGRGVRTYKVAGPQWLLSPHHTTTGCSVAIPDDVLNADMETGPGKYCIVEGEIRAIKTRYWITDRHSVRESIAVPVGQVISIVVTDDATSSQPANSIQELIDDKYTEDAPSDNHFRDLLKNIILD